MSEYDDPDFGDEICEYCGELEADCECCTCCAVHTPDEIDSGICDACGGIIYA
jgi:hypothetical protein